MWTFDALNREPQAIVDAVSVKKQVFSPMTCMLMQSQVHRKNLATVLFR